MKNYLPLLLLGALSFAAAPTRPAASVAVSGTTISSSAYNNDLNTLYNYLQSGVDTFAAGSISNSAISASAGIAYSKLTLTGSIVNADISASAAIDGTKIASIPGSILTTLSGIPSGAGLIPVANITAFPYVKVSDTKVSGTVGGTASTGAWTTHAMNTEDTDSAAIASIAANRVTLPAGTYQFRSVSIFHKTDNSQIRLQNITAGTTLLIGMTSFSGNASAINLPDSVVGQFVLAAPSALEIQYQVSTSTDTSDLGAPNAFTSEVYMTAEFWKVL